MANKTVKNLTVAAMIAALYTALTLIVAPISYGPLQFRISEALTVLPAVCPPAVLGLTLGCFISNVIGFIMGANPIGLVDAVLGSVATLLAAILTAYIGKKCRGLSLYLLAPLPPVILNGLIIGAELAFLVMGGFTPLNMLLSFCYVAFGELVVCYVGGVTLLKGGKKFFNKYL